MCSALGSGALPGSAFCQLLVLGVGSAEIKNLFTLAQSFPVSQQELPWLPAQPWGHGELPGIPLPLVGLGTTGTAPAGKWSLWSGSGSSPRAVLGAMERYQG